MLIFIQQVSNQNEDMRISFYEMMIEIGELYKYMDIKDRLENMLFSNDINVFRIHGNDFGQDDKF